MAWKALDRHTPQYDTGAAPLISEALKQRILSFVPRYETKRAVLLPALHIVQESLGHLSDQAMVEIARILELPPSQVLDTATFYTHYWRGPRGKKVVMFLTKEAVRIGLPGGAEGVACDGCPPLPTLFAQYADGGGELLVCPICFTARKLDDEALVPNARLAGATPLWEWIDDGATVFSY